MAIWRACDGETTVAEIAEAIGELASLSFDQALEMTVETIESFYELGLLN